MQWQMSRMSYSDNKEIPFSIDELINLLPFQQPENDWQALMEAPPGTEPATPKTVVNELVEIVRDCVEILLPQDQYVVHAIAYERTTYDELGKRLGVSPPHAWRLTQIAYQHLSEVLMIDGRIRKYIVDDE